VLFHAIENQFGVAGLFGFMVLFGVVVYVLLSGASYLVFFVWLRERFVPAYRPDRAEMWKSARWALFSISGNAALMAPVELAIIHGDSRIYFDVADHGWGWLALSAALVLVVTETSIYWIHRALHTPWLYRRLHVHHHQFREPTPLASVAFHPFDSFAQALPYHLCAFLFPLHVWVYHGFVTLVTIWSVMIHDRIRWVPTEWVNHTGCHTAHHWFYRCNYGQYFTLWDRLCGTYRSAAALPERFAASWPAGSRRTARAGGVPRAAPERGA